MRVAMTPHEIWHDGLEKAAQQYMEFKDLSGMQKTLFSLHEAMNVPATSNSSGSKLSTSLKRDSEDVYENVFTEVGRVYVLYSIWVYYGVYSIIFIRILCIYACIYIYGYV